MKKGFTLAEVLITLAIIGVVAALTIPTVMAKYNQKAQYTQFMKVYNTISNVFSLASAESSPMTWNYDSTDMNEFFDSHIAPYLKIASRGNVEDYFGTAQVKTLAGGDHVFSFSGLCGMLSCSDAVTTQDGASLIVAHASSLDKGNHEYAQIIFDTNGSKNPNMFGRDQFMMELGYNTEGSVKKPYFGILIGTDDDSFCNPNGESVIGNGIPQGIGCPAKLLKEGKMNY